MSYRRNPRAAVVEDPERLTCWILTLSADHILELEGTSYLIWRATSTAGNTTSIVEDLCQEFGWDRNEIIQGVEQFVEDLVAREVLLEEIK